VNQLQIKIGQVWQENTYKERILVVMNVSKDNVYMFTIDNLFTGNILYTRDIAQSSLRENFTLIAEKYVIPYSELA